MQSMWDNIKSWFKNSATILWARIQVLAGIISASLIALTSDPNVTGAIQAALQPKFIPTTSSPSAWSPKSRGAALSDECLDVCHHSKSTR